MCFWWRPPGWCRLPRGTQRPKCRKDTWATVRGKRVSVCLFLALAGWSSQLGEGEVLIGRLLPQPPRQRGKKPGSWGLGLWGRRDILSPNATLSAGARQGSPRVGAASPWAFISPRVHRMLLVLTYNHARLFHPSKPLLPTYGSLFGGGALADTDAWKGALPPNLYFSVQVRAPDCGRGMVAGPGLLETGAAWRNWRAWPPGSLCFVGLGSLGSLGGGKMEVLRPGSWPSRASGWLGPPGQVGSPEGSSQELGAD